MRYMIIENTNTESNVIAEFDDLTRAKSYVDYITKNLNTVDPADTDPTFISYSITDTSTCHNDGLEPDEVGYDPTGLEVWSSKTFYLEP